MGNTKILFFVLLQLIAWNPTLISAILSFFPEVLRKHCCRSEVFEPPVMELSKFDIYLIGFLVVPIYFAVFMIGPWRVIRSVLISTEFFQKTVQ